MSETPYTLVTDPAGVERMLADIKGHAVIGVDTETTGLDPYRSRVRLLQIATPDNSFVIDLFRVAAFDHQPLRRLGYDALGVQFPHTAPVELADPTIGAIRQLDSHPTIRVPEPSSALSRMR